MTHLSISVGCYTLRPTPETEMQSVIEHADRALYIAKDRGRNCLVSVP